MPYALKPAAALAASRGVAAPLHAGMAAMFDAVLGGTGPAPTLPDLGLDDGRPA